jgi:hypothetical protein
MLAFEGACKNILSYCFQISTLSLYYSTLTSKDSRTIKNSYEQLKKIEYHVNSFFDNCEFINDD